MTHQGVAYKTTIRLISSLGRGLPTSQPPSSSRGTWTECHRLLMTFMRARYSSIVPLRGRIMHLLQRVVQRVPSTPHLPIPRAGDTAYRGSPRGSARVSGSPAVVIGSDLLCDPADVECYARTETGRLADTATDHTVAGYRSLPRCTALSAGVGQGFQGHPHRPV